MEKEKSRVLMEEESSRLEQELDEDLEKVDLETLKEKAKYNPEYNLRKRTIVTRLKTEKSKSLPKQPKPKSSPAPLSKYRRKTANARERDRMQDINGAFKELQDVIPNIEQGQGNKMTKVTTLRLAMNYISALRQTLGYEDFASKSPLSSPDSCDFISSSPSSSSSDQCDLGLSNCCLSSPSSTSSPSSDLNSDGDSVRSSSVSSSADEAVLSPIDGDILQAQFSTEEFDMMCSDMSDTIGEICP